MDRREVLKLSAAVALSGCGAGAGGSIASPPGSSGGMSDAEVKETLAQLDLTIAKLAALPPQPELYLHTVRFGANSPPPSGYLNRSEI